MIFGWWATTQKIKSKGLFVGRYYFRIVIYFYNAICQPLSEGSAPHSHSLDVSFTPAPCTNPEFNITASIIR